MPDMAKFRFRVISSSLQDAWVADMSVCRYLFVGTMSPNAVERHPWAWGYKTVELPRLTCHYFPEPATFLNTIN